MLLNCAMTACQKGDRWAQAAGLLGCWAAGLLGWAPARSCDDCSLSDLRLVFSFSVVSLVSHRICRDMLRDADIFRKDCPGMEPEWSRMEQNAPGFADLASAAKCGRLQRGDHSLVVVPRIRCPQ